MELLEKVLENESLDEITDPVARAKLAGIQEAVFGIDALIINLRKSVDEKRGVIAASDAIAKRLMEECLPYQKATEEEKIDKDEAKLRIDTIQRMVAIVREVGAENRRDLVHFQGQVAGLEKAAKSAEEKFNGETQKYQRWQRVQAEEDDLGRKAVEDAEVAVGKQKKVAPKGEPKGKAKGVKAAKTVS
jgi:hypothetical protein